MASAWAAGPPKRAAASPSAADFALGSAVKLTTSDGEAVSGEVFACDRATEVLVLKAPGAAADESVLRVLSLSAIKEVTERTPPAAGYVPEKLPAVDDARSARRLEEAVRAAEAESERVGVGVTRQAQLLFDALSKTYPCRWRETTIAVMDTVLIRPPYTPDSCQGGNPTERERVQMVVASLAAALAPA